MEQHPLIAIDIGNTGLAGCGGYKTGVVSEYSFGYQIPDIYDIRSKGAAVNWQLKSIFTTFNG